MKSSNENVVVSPLSMATVLLCVAEAANGKAFDELYKILHLDGDKEKNANEFMKLRDQLKNGSDGLKLLMASQVIVPEEFTLNESYRKVAIMKFGVDVDSIVLSEKTQSARAINRFIGAKRTKKMCNMISSETFDDPLLRVVLLNSISFEARWNKPFDPSFTDFGDFFTSKTNKVSVQYMKQSDQIECYNYAVLNDLDATAIELKYRDSDFSFVIVLPNSRTGLHELESRLKNYDLAKLDGNQFNQMLGQSIVIDLKIPRFKIEFKTDLKDLLMQVCAFGYLFDRYFGTFIRRFSISSR